MEFIADAIDRRIIHLLQSNGKMKIKDIAEQLGMTTTPIFERIKRLEKEGYIKGYTALADRKKLGFHLTAFCSVTLRSHTKETLTKFVENVKQLPQVTECYHIAGMVDYLLKIQVEDMDAYQEFITEKLTGISNIGRLQSSFVMTEVKNDPVLPL